MTIFLWLTLTCTNQVDHRLSNRNTLRLKSVTDQVKQVQQKCVGAPHQFQNSHKMPNCLLCQISSMVFIFLVVGAEPLDQLVPAAASPCSTPQGVKPNILELFQIFKNISIPARCPTKYFSIIQNTSKYSAQKVFQFFF